MATKRIEVSRAPDGRFIWQIGEVDSIGAGFGCFYIDQSSGTWGRYDKDGKYTSNRSLPLVYKGDFFDTSKEALEAGRLARDAD